MSAAQLCLLPSAQKWCQLASNPVAAIARSVAAQTTLVRQSTRRIRQPWRLRTASSAHPHGMQKRQQLPIDFSIDALVCIAGFSSTLSSSRRTPPCISYYPFLRIRHAANGRGKTISWLCVPPSAMLTIAIESQPTISCCVVMIPWYTIDMTYAKLYLIQRKMRYHSEWAEAVIGAVDLVLQTVSDA